MDTDRGSCPIDDPVYVPTCAGHSVAGRVPRKVELWDRVAITHLEWALIDTDIPAGMTLRQWRRLTPAGRRVAAYIVAAQAVSA